MDFPSTRGQRKVRFSSRSTLKLIKYPTAEENRAKWYSLEDEKRFKCKRYQDAIKCSLKMMQYLNDPTQNGMISHEDIVGLENHISRDVDRQAKAVKAIRTNHVATVLAEQDSQQLVREDCPEKLALVSAFSSKSEMARVLKVGKLHALVASDTKM